jgi:hypothetical protein
MKGYNVWRNFRESPKSEVRRITIPRTSVNKGEKKGALVTCAAIVSAEGEGEAKIE